MTTAIYARQSVERKASISIDMQVETCRRQIPLDVQCKVYTDRGFSGTNTARPAFQQMLKDIQAGLLDEVYVYKLDRISRSLCDFAAMMQMFRQKGVTLHSCRESFDTRSEIGAMLLNLLIMFAELEQKTIAGRVRDNYYARAEQHLALGGKPPFGFDAVECSVIGRKTTVLHENPDEAALIQRFYEQYGVAGWNVEQIVHAANESGETTRNCARWSNSSILRILRNPVYVKGNLSVVRFFQQSGAILMHAPEEYCRGNGSLVIGDKKNRIGGKLTSLKGEHIAAGLHKGVIDPALWLAVQERLHDRGGSSNNGTGRRSWLQGKVVCGLCGERCYVRGNGKGALYTYFVCRGKRLGICNGLHALRVSRVEKAVESVFLQRAAFVLPYAVAETVESTETPDSAALELEELTQKMRRIAGEIAESTVADSFLRQELERLAEQYETRKRQIRRCQAVFPQSANILWKSWWENAGLEQRRQAVGILIREIRLYQDGAELFFR